MGLLDKLLGERRDRDTHGRIDDPNRGVQQDPAGDMTADRGGADRGVADRRVGGRDADEVAVQRYRYMLRTAPPETVEQAHAEAFAKLTPEQRRQVLAELRTATPEVERGTADDPQSLARTATRAEMRQPGTMERVLGGRGGMGMGGMLAGSLLASVAGAFIGTSIAGAFLDDDLAGGPGADEPGAGDQAAGAGDEDLAAEGGGTGFDDPGAGELGGMDDLGI